MRFLNRWFSRFRSSPPADPSPPPERILGPEERIARFLHHRSHFSRPTGVVKHTAFQPPSTETGISVAHVTALADPQIWEIARATLNEASGRGQVVGRADLAVATVQQQGLAAVRDDLGFPRHTTLGGWPVRADRNEQREIRKQIALRLGDAAELRLSDPPIVVESR